MDCPLQKPAEDKPPLHHAFQAIERVVGLQGVQTACGQGVGHVPDDEVHQEHALLQPEEEESRELPFRAFATDKNSSLREFLPHPRAWQTLRCAPRPNFRAASRSLADAMSLEEVKRSTRTRKLSSRVRVFDEHTRAEITRKKLDALEKDNWLEDKRAMR